MPDATRAGFPNEMYRAAQRGDAGQLEGMAEDLVDSLKRYVHDQPVPAMLWALGIGFVLGWKLKPW